jgi:hypothetical protein
LNQRIQIPSKDLESDNIIFVVGTIKSKFSKARIQKTPQQQLGFSDEIGSSGKKQRYLRISKTSLIDDDGRLKRESQKSLPLFSCGGVK